MRDKSRVGGSKMHVARINDPIWLGTEAKRFSRELLLKEHRGPGDTIEAAADRIANHDSEVTAIILQGWNRPAREWKVSRWMTLFVVHWDAIGSKAAAAYEEKRNEADGTHPALLWLADTVAGRVVAEEAERTNTRRP